MDYKQEIARILSSEININEEKLIDLIEIPPEQKMGDFAFPCFSLSKELKKSPAAIAEELAGKLEKGEIISEIKAIGPYLNFFLDKTKEAEHVLKEISDKKEKYGKGESKNETILLEFPSPNTNKPLHLGHLRNILLGKSIDNILSFNGYNVKKCNMNNDRGISITKTMLAYKKFGENKDPDIKSDKFVGNYYVKYAKEAEKNPELEKEAQQMLIDEEKGDEEVKKLWRKIIDWTIAGYHETYKKLNLKFDKEYFESEIYTKGKEIVEKGLKSGVFEKDEDGAIFIDLEKYKLGKKYLLRSDGTSTYMVFDLFLGKLKYEDFKFDRSIYIVGSEQNQYFKQLFKILSILDSDIKGFHHLSYGLISLPDGKMKSREGTVVDIDDFLEEIKQNATVEIKKRYNDIKEDELEKRATVISIAAINMFILKYDPVKDFVFNPKESLSFEGETGPYLLYSYARINSIQKKANKKPNPDFNQLNLDIEHKIIGLLRRFGEVVNESAENYKPSTLARYLIELAQTFNTYYHHTQIIGSKEEESRLFLLESIKNVLKTGLKLLDIDVLEQM